MKQYKMKINTKERGQHNFLSGVAENLFKSQVAWQRESKLKVFCREELKYYAVILVLGLL